LNYEKIYLSHVIEINLNTREQNDLYEYKI